MSLFKKFKTWHIVFGIFIILYISGILIYHSSIKIELFSHSTYNRQPRTSEEIQREITKKERALYQGDGFVRKVIYTPTLGYVVENELMLSGYLRDDMTAGKNQQQIDEMKAKVIKMIKNLPATYVSGHYGNYWRITRTTTPEEYIGIINELWDAGAVVIPNSISSGL